MYGYKIPLSHPVSYTLTGKFQAPSADWIHENYPLLEYELFVMTEGILYLNYNGIDYVVKKGESLLLPPLPPPQNHRRGYRSSQCSFYWLHFSSTEDVCSEEITQPAVDAYAQSDTLLLPIQFELTSMDKMIVLMKQLQDYVRCSYQRTALDYMTTTILCELFYQSRNDVLQFHTNLIPLTPGKKQIYNDLMDYVKRNVSKNLKVIDIAKQFGYNEKYLSHLFLTLSGMPLKQYVLRVKMEEANYLLSDTNLSIYEIARSIGFTDRHNFMTAYKKITGLTPSEYRNAFSKRLLYHK